MHLVIDSNSLQSSQLEAFLSKASTNMAVIADYVSMEAYKGETLKNIYDRMSILVSFPKQVVVLRGTRTVCGLRGRSAGLQRRLIDEKQSKEFREFALRLRDAQAGNHFYQAQLLELGQTATEQLTKLLQDAERISGVLLEVAKPFTKEERCTVRAGRLFTVAMVNKLVRVVMEIAAQVFRDHPNVRSLPCFTELPNTFIFRLSLCMYLLALHWAAHGGAANARIEKIRNDIVDMYVTAFATYFDGLMSADKKACQIHQEARLILMGAFDCKLPSGIGR